MDITLWKNEKSTLTEKKNSSNQLFSIFFSKTVTFTKFLPKMRESEFLEFPQCGAVMYRNLLSNFFNRNFVKVADLQS